MRTVLLLLFVPTLAHAGGPPLTLVPAMELPARMSFDRPMVLDLDGAMVLTGNRHETIVRELDGGDLSFFRAGLHWGSSGFDAVTTTTLAITAPGQLDAATWQKSELTLRYELPGELLSLRGHGLVGSLTQHGFTWSAGGALEMPFTLFRSDDNEGHVVLWLSAGAESTTLDLDGPKATFTDLVTAVELDHYACDHKQDSPCINLWVRFELKSPLGDHGDALLDDTAGLHTTLGMALSWQRKWMVSLQGDWLKRGNRDTPGTQWPVAEGGFDLGELTMRVTRRFGR